MHDTTTGALATARSALASVFLEFLEEGGLDFARFEQEAIGAGHAAIAAAMGDALTRRDEALCAGGVAGLRSRGLRPRSLATEVGDVDFSWHRMSDRYGNSVYPLADDLDLPWRARVSPGACDFLVQAGANVSYQKACNLLARGGGSRVSPSMCMRALRTVGGLCEGQDAEAARQLVENGVLPGGETEAEVLFVESDGVWVSLQKPGEGEPRKVEVKAMCAYAGKSDRGGRTRRSRVVSHGCVAPSGQFWAEGVAAAGERFDLSKVKVCHSGFDGEPWCKEGMAAFPASEAAAGHLDPFHVNRAILTCFDAGREGRRAAWHVIDVAAEGEAGSAAALLEAMAGHGIARPKQARKVAAYLRNHAEFLVADAPSLGTMESENQHLYSARMEAWPCAWSAQGASDMARIRSRIHSGRALPAQTREGSMSLRARRRREARELSFYSGNTGRVVEFDGSGYLPRQASVAGMAAEVRHAAAVDSGMVALMG